MSIKSTFFKLLGRAQQLEPNAETSISGDTRARGQNSRQQLADIAADNMTFNIAAEVDHFFDDSSLALGSQPVFKVFLGARGYRQNHLATRPVLDWVCGD